MRKHLVWILAAILAISVAGYAWARADTETSKATVKVTPSKLSKTKFKNASLAVETSTLNNSDTGGTPTNPTTQPGPTNDVKLQFDDDLKFDPKGLGQCDINNLQGTTTAGAKAACGKEQVGAGSATVCFAPGVGTGCITPPGANNPNLHAVVTAFNGKPNGGKPTILLHSRVENGGFTNTTVLTGTLTKQNAGDYGYTLDVPVGPLPASSITDFQTKVGKTFKVKGKKHYYVTARCHDSNKHIDMKSTFHYTDSGESTDTDHEFSTCKT
jgi:hypothetical protein